MYIKQLQKGQIKYLHEKINTGFISMILDTL